MSNHESSTRKKKRHLFFIGLLVLALFLVGCGKGNQSADKSKDNTASQEKVVKDAMGHEVTIPAHPKRMIATYLEDPLIVLGEKPVAQWSVASGVQDYLKKDLKGVPTISYDLPPEQVMSFNPDFIIVSSESLVQKGLYDQYKKIAPTYVLGDKIASDWRKTLLKMGDLLNKKNKAEVALKDYDKKATETKAKLHDAIDNQSVAVLWLTQKQFYIVNKDQSSGAVLYKDLGLAVPKMVADLPEQNAAWNPISLEKLAELDSDHIFLINYDKGQSGDIMDSTVWKNLKAVKSGHVYEMGKDHSWLYSGLIANEQIMDDVASALVK